MGAMRRSMRPTMEAVWGVVAARVLLTRVFRSGLAGLVGSASARMIRPLWSLWPGAESNSGRGRAAAPLRGLMPLRPCHVADLGRCLSLTPPSWVVALAAEAVEAGLALVIVRVRVLRSCVRLLLRRGAPGAAVLAVGLAVAPPTCRVRPRAALWLGEAVGRLFCLILGSGWRRV